jgi:hypothetical protein
MATAQWMKVLDTVSNLAQLWSGFAGKSQASAPSTPPHATGMAAPFGAGPSDPRGLGPLETRLAGVVVAALKEAFDRDRARMDLERDTLEGERSRAERALAAELRRQAADRALAQLQLIAVFAGLALLVSGVLAAWIGGMRDGTAAVLLTIGWTLAVAALGCVFAAWQQVSRWASQTDPPPAGASTLAAVAPWLLLGSLATTAASLLLAR